MIRPNKLERSMRSVCTRSANRSSGKGLRRRTGQSGVRVSSHAVLRLKQRVRSVTSRDPTVSASADGASRAKRCAREPVARSNKAQTPRIEQPLTLTIHQLFFRSRFIISIKWIDNLVQRCRAAPSTGSSDTGPFSSVSSTGSNTNTKLWWLSVGVSGRFPIHSTSLCLTRKKKKR